MIPSTSTSRGFGRAGAFATLLVLFLDLLWRAMIGAASGPSLPETVVAAVARLTPVAIFGWATETFGSLAQNTLFATVLVGFILAGYRAGQVVESLSRQRKNAPSRPVLPLGVVLRSIPRMRHHGSRVGLLIRRRLRYGQSWRRQP